MGKMIPGRPSDASAMASQPEPLDAAAVARAATAVIQFLNVHCDRDWTPAAGSLEWSCRDTAIHIAHDLLAYAGQLSWGVSDSYLPMDLTVRSEATNRQVLAIIGASAKMLERAVAAAQPSERAWHWGPTDSSGFSALGITEMLVHTWDIAQGLALEWRPPPELSVRVLERLVPDAPTGDPSEGLLWATGRVALLDRARLVDWRVQASRGDTDE
jgi:Mycothiol maleylpyruvate isomerase N-terminal domain